MRNIKTTAIALLTIVVSLGLCSYSSVPSSDEFGQQAADSQQVVSFRSPNCGCCEGWIEHMRANGFQVEDHVVDDIEAVKQEHHLPADLTSCHTAIASGYVIEGHVPAADVRRLLAEKPDVVGITVPGMPMGSPGMESGDVRQPYTVYTFTEEGTPEVFQEHS